ncbi:MAG: hypothetical protein AAGG48_10695 [Planctomycetota bacterium]
MSNRVVFVSILWCGFVACCFCDHVEAETLPSGKRSLDLVLTEFQEYSGSTLVFSREELPDGRYHDVLKPLPESKKLKAAEICLKEVKKYPPGFFGEMGLRCIGVFSACASKKSVGYSRPYDAQLGGYRYFGVYNRRDAVAAAFYTEGQLELTFHHEVFHHVDSTVNGDTEAWQLSADDAFYDAAISGMRPYEAALISASDIDRLKAQRIGITLKDTVSDYAATNSREDQAETARHLMSTLSDALVQATEQPDLPGSQRILHVLREYENAVADGPSIDWFVDVALSRSKRRVSPHSVTQLLVQLREFAESGASGYSGVENDPSAARELLRSVVRFNTDLLNQQQATDVVNLAADVTGALMRQRIRPDPAGRRFDVWGRENENGINMTLRRDIMRFAKDSKRLALISEQINPASSESHEAVLRQQLENLHLVGRYFAFIKSSWTVTAGTKAVFETAKTEMLQSMQLSDAFARELEAKSLIEISEQMPEMIRAMTGTEGNRAD